MGTLSVGLFLAASVAGSRERGPERWWIVALLASAAAFSGEFAAMHSGLYRFPMYFVTYPLFFLMGPAAWVTVRTLGGEGTPLRAAWPHLLPALAAAVDLSGYYADIARAGGQPAHGGHTLTGLRPYGQCLIQLTHTGVYALLASRGLRRLEGLARDSHSGDAVQRVRWAALLCRSLWILIIVELGAVLTMKLSRHHVLAAEYAMGFAVGGLVIALGWMLLRHPRPLTAPGEKYRRSALSEHAMAEYATCLIRSFEERQLWLDPELTLAGLAEKTGIARHHLSQVLSRSLRTTFFDFVNGYRVREAARQLLSSDGEKTMLAVAYDSGFSSKASFNRVFKRTLGRTPSQFRVSGSLDEPELRPVRPLDVG